MPAFARKRGGLAACRVMSGEGRAKPLRFGGGLVRQWTAGARVVKVAVTMKSWCVEQLEGRVMLSAVRFAVIGDYGSAGQPEADVAEMVKGWGPELVVTVGDNNYGENAVEAFDDNVGRYFHEFIYNYAGRFGEGSPTRRFFPVLGNHDWDGAPGAGPYLEYFDLPDPPDDSGDERYYEFTAGPVHFFALDSDAREPDGITSSSTQGKWLKAKLAAATEPFKVVVLHHPPYSSGEHGNNPKLQWPFKQWGATAVLAGHDHHYERLEVGGLPYFVNGLGGRDIAPYSRDAVAAGSRFRYDEDFGAMRVE